MSNKLQLFGNAKIRSSWNKKEEEWYFSIVDVIEVLTQSPSPGAYWRKLKQRLKEEGNETVTNCHGLKMMAADGKMRTTDVGTAENIFRLIQSIPSPRAEPLKLWLAKVAKERLDEEIDPQKAIDRARESYRRKGYPEEWINTRMKGIETRVALTAEWKEHGVKDQQYAMLTDIIHRGTFEVSVREHKALKGLTKENLRDNMTLVESALTTLAEATATEITRAQDPQCIEENKSIAKTSGNIAGNARKKIEAETGRKVLSSKNARHLIEEERQRKLSSKS